MLQINHLWGILAVHRTSTVGITFACPFHCYSCRTQQLYHVSNVKVNHARWLYTRAMPSHFSCIDQDSNQTGQQIDTVNVA